MQITKPGLEVRGRKADGQWWCCIDNFWEHRIPDWGSRPASCRSWAQRDDWPFASRIASSQEGRGGIPHRLIRDCNLADTLVDTVAFLYIKPRKLLLIDLSSRLIFMTISSGHTMMARTLLMQCCK